MLITFLELRYFFFFFWTLAPCPLPRGLVGPGWKENAVHIWKASGAPPDVPGRRAGAAGGGGEPRSFPPYPPSPHPTPATSRAVSAGAEEGPGLAPSPAPPAAGFHPQIWPRVPLRRKLSLLNAGKTG